MIRTQIELTDLQVRRLRAQAREHGVSLAEMIRRCVDKALAEEAAKRIALYDRAARLIGRFPDHRGARDVSTRHGGYLDEAYE
jgi:hypothetical protein